MTTALPHYDLLIPGTYFCDVIFTGLPRFPSLGTEIYCEGLNVVPGGVMNSVIALRRLGVNVGWIGLIGTDFFSNFVMQWAEREAIDTTLLVRTDGPMRRITVSLSYPQDRSFITYIDPAPDRVEMGLQAFEVATFRHFHFTSLEVNERVPDLLDRCRAEGISTSMDCQHREVTLDTPLVRDILARVDMFMPNSTEARNVTCAKTTDEALDALSVFAPYVIIKDGANGALARCKGVTYREPALHFDSVVDTTGAGDVFNAGFLTAFLEGRDTRACLQWGNYCGGMSTQGPGGSTRAPRRIELDQWLNT